MPLTGAWKCQVSEESGAAINNSEHVLMYTLATEGGGGENYREEPPKTLFKDAFSYDDTDYSGSI